MINLTILLRLNLMICALIAVSSIIPLTIRRHLPEEKLRARMILRIFSFVLFVGGVIAFLACCGRNTYIDSMVEDADESTAGSRYLPFSEGSDLTRLDEESELTLTGDEPVIDGSANLLPYYASMIEMIYPESIMEDYEESPEDCPFQYSGTAEAYSRLLEGVVDIVFSEEPDDDVLEAAKEEGLTLEVTEIGTVPFIFFVNRDNTVDDLSMIQIQEIYSGRLTDWSLVGGEEEPILAFQCQEDSSAQDYLESIVETGSLMQSEQTYMLNTEQGIEETAQTYSNAPGAIGCAFNCYVRDLDVDMGLKMLSINGIYPDTDQTGWQDYLYQQKICLVTVKERENTQVSKIREWVLSEQGQRLLTSSGYLPLTEESGQ